MATAASIRQGIKWIAREDKPSLYGGVYIPWAHARVLSREIPIVIGERGVGKSYYADLLASESVLAHVRDGLQECLPREGDTVIPVFPADSPDVDFGLGGREKLRHTVGFEAFWQAALLMEAIKLNLPDVNAILTPLSGLGSWLSRSEWIKENEGRLEGALERLSESFAGSTLYFTVDELSRFDHDDIMVKHMAKGLAEVALCVRKFQNVRIKAFMTPSEAEFISPLARYSAGTIAWNNEDRISHLLTAISNEECDSLRSLVGKYMNIEKPKRGTTQAWLVSRIRDVSPNFLVSLIVEAANITDNKYADSVTPIHPASLREAYFVASREYVTSVSQEERWVAELMTPLAGAIQGAGSSPLDIYDAWDLSGVFNNLSVRNANIFHPADALRRLTERKICRIMATGCVDFNPVYAAGFGLRGA